MVAEIPSYPWYTRIEDVSLEQGDFFSGCPVLEPVLPDELKRGQDSLQAVVKEYDVIVLSQSCDLIAGKLDEVAILRKFPGTRLRAGDVAVLVDIVPHPAGGEDGVVLEVFNAIGESIAVVTVPRSAVAPLRAIKCRLCACWRRPDAAAADGANTR